ncbi:unnamed protein product [Discosporangium mesarthrocarpum]
MSSLRPPADRDEDKRYPLPIANGPVVPVPGVEGVYVVEGIFCIAGPLKIARTMCIFVGPDRELTLVNTMRLDARGEAQLRGLGQVKRVVRICSLHGMDDPYYVHRFGAELWGMHGMTWDEHCIMCEPVVMTHDLLEVTLHNLIIQECIIFFRDKQLLVTCDFIMQCENPEHEKISDLNFGWLGRWVGRCLGFKGEAITPPYYVKNFTTEKNYACIRATSYMIQELPYTVIISGHGPPMLVDAKERRQAFINSVDWGV